MSNYLAAVVIPIYKDVINANEIASLKQCIKILGSYNIIFVCPDKLKFDNYQAYVSNLNYKIERFDNDYFKDIEGYNKLMLSRNFYKRFIEFKYILIYQLDAWVFKDELIYWCSKNIDYIGAPWLKGWANTGDNLEFLGVGNGGFSLRNVKSHLKVLNSFSYINDPLFYVKVFLKHPSKISLTRLLENTTIKNNTFHLFNDYASNEDIFWGMCAAKSFSWFKVADVKTALRFSVEVNAASFIKDDKSLPFGCHAWEKYDAEFWKSLMIKN